MHQTAEDLATRLALEMQVHDALDKLDTTIDATIGFASKLPPEKRTQLERAVSSVVRLGIHSSEGESFHETKLREHLAFLANELEAPYEKPTAAEYTTFRGASSTCGSWRGTLAAPDRATLMTSGRISQLPNAASRLKRWR